VARARPYIERNRRERPTPVAAWRLVVMALCLVAATVQGYLVQTHGHSPPRPRAGLAAHLTGNTPALVSSAGLLGEDRPITQPNTTTACPICQAGLSGTAPLVSAVAAAVAALASVWIPASSRIVSPLISAVSYSWQSRGPPLI
jgi:hypothetical protein